MAFNHRHNYFDGYMTGCAESKIKVLRPEITHSEMESLEFFHSKKAKFSIRSTQILIALHHHLILTNFYSEILREVLRLKSIFINSGCMLYRTFQKI